VLRILLQAYERIALMKPNHLDSQEGMEKIFREYCSRCASDESGRINVMCIPEFVDCDFNGKTLTLSYVVRDWMLNPTNVMHGGILSTVFDLTMGLLSVYFSDGRMTPTTTLQVTFLRPIPAGETLVVQAYCDKSGRTMCAVSGKAWLGTAPDQFTATATGTYFTAGNDMVSWTLPQSC
jgi:acyl-CoA thioesterase